MKSFYEALGISTKIYVHSHNKMSQNIDYKFTDINHTTSNYEVEDNFLLAENIDECFPRYDKPTNKNEK